MSSGSYRNGGSISRGGGGGGGGGAMKVENYGSKYSSSSSSFKSKVQQSTVGSSSLRRSSTGSTRDDSTGNLWRKLDARVLLKCGQFGWVLCNIWIFRYFILNKFVGFLVFSFFSS